jgi:hypothetical protein
MAENEFTERKLLYFVNCSVSKIMNDLKKSLKMEFKKKKYFTKVCSIEFIFLNEKNIC